MRTYCFVSVCNVQVDMYSFGVVLWVSSTAQMSCKQHVLAFKTLLNM